MHVKYRCQVKGFIRLKFKFELPSNFITYDFELGEHGKLTHVSAIIPVQDKSLWPTFHKSTQLGVSFNISFKSPFFEIVRQDMRAAEGMLALFGLESINTENAEEIWLPDTLEEKAELKVNNMQRKTELRPIQELPYSEFDLVARAFLSAHRGRSIESLLSFFRKGRADIIESRYLEAVFDFLFMIESNYANGKFKSTQVEQEYLSNQELIDQIRISLRDDTVQQNVSGDNRIAEAFRRDYFSRSPVEIVKHIVKLRGFLHHHTKGKKGIWHPDDHVRYGADAFFLQQLCFNIGFRLIDPILFAPEHVHQYQALAKAYATSVNR